jgi:hypothetical protein
MASATMVRSDTSEESQFANSARDVALMMHTHLLSPVKFAHDIAQSPRYDKLARSIDFPLLQMLAKIQNNNHNPDKSLSTSLWGRKFPNFPYDLLVKAPGSPYKSFPPPMSLSPTYDPKKFSFSKSNPFSLDLVQAVKRQIAFAHKITEIYPYDPVPDGLFLDSQQRYAKFINLIRLKACSTPAPAMDIDLF